MSVYADHPFPVLATPSGKLPEGTKPDIFHDLASEMTHVHNIMFRGLNSIYLQAPHISPEDTDSFCNYMELWYEWLHAHHEGEEAILFPGIERLSGEAGIMEANVEQHRAFAEGLDAFGKHCKALVAGTEKFDGKRVIELIDSFGPTLTEHLTEEIDTLLGLKRFGEEKMKDVLKIAAEEAGTVMRGIGLTTGLPFAIVNLDRHFENDSWLTVFPPQPGQTMLAIVRNTTFYYHRDWWKFGSCDRLGNLKPLYAVADLPKSATNGHAVNGIESNGVPVAA